MSRRTTPVPLTAGATTSQGAHPEEGRQGGSVDEQRKHRVLSQGVASVVRSIADALVIKHRDVFFVCPPDGSLPLEGQHGYGLYHHDCRYLGGYELHIGGARAHALAATAAQGTSGVLELTNPDIRQADDVLIAKETVGITWTRLVDGDAPALFDEITMRRYGNEAVDLPLDLRFAANFEDIYAIRGLWTQRLGRLAAPAWDDDALVFGYRGADDIERRLTVRFEPPPGRRNDSAAGFDVHLEPGMPVHIRLSLAVEERPLTGSARPDDAPVPPRDVDYTILPVGRHESGWLARAAEVDTDSARLEAIMERSLLDLRLLRSSLSSGDYFAAGVPWFVTLFGRDSIITALQTLAFDATIAEATLALLAAHQGTRDDAWKDEEPGKILHELRVGEYARTGVIPHTPYYGTVDATPLFLILLARHAAWTGSLDLFRELRGSVDAALGWIDRTTAASETGYVEYRSASHRGLVNQGWKDSGDAVVNDDGTLAEPPIAMVEVQGYVVDAKRSMAALFRRVRDPERAERLEREAEDLRARIERDFWLDGPGLYAMALQRGGRPCAVRSSNPGHLLWSGVPSPERAEATVRMLLSPDLFNGWGVRTLSDRERRYNPIGYHLGTVWPHDNAIIAAGLRRYGHDDEAMRITRALLEAAVDFEELRLPEAFAGFARDAYGVPVRYPVACHPQAWAAGSIPFLVVELAGLRPDAFEGRLEIVRPQIPPFADHMELRRLRVAGAEVDLRFERRRGDVHVDVLRIDGDLDVRVDRG